MGRGRLQERPAYDGLDAVVVVVVAAADVDDRPAVLVDSYAVVLVPAELVPMLVGADGAQFAAAAAVVLESMQQQQQPPPLQQYLVVDIDCCGHHFDHDH